NSTTLTEGGSARQYYTQDMHAVAPDGSTYFTAAGSGQLYLRVNPTQPQSAVAVNPTTNDEECTEAARASTVHASATEKATAGAPPAPTPAPSRPPPAAGTPASSPPAEKLTDAPTTAPEPTPPAIGRADLETGQGKDESFLPATAGGIAVQNGFIYWADPVHGT